jgi:hypothetical protein
LGRAYFGALIKIAKRNKMSSSDIANMIAAEPPNLVQRLGPEAFLKYARYALEQCNTPFVRERKKWIGVFAEWFDPYFPEADNVPKTFILIVNAKALESCPKTSSKIFELLLQHGLDEWSEWSSVLENLSEYAFAVDPTALLQPDTSLGVKPLLGALPLELHTKVFEFVNDGELLNFGRPCKTAAALVCQFTSEKAKEDWTRKKEDTWASRTCDELERRMKRHGLSFLERRAVTFWGPKWVLMHGRLVIHYSPKYRGLLMLLMMR